MCAALLHRALGPERIIALHVDHGFMRLDESSSVVTALQALGVPIERLDVAETFGDATTEVATAATFHFGKRRHFLRTA